MPKLLDAYRTGDGVDWADYGPDVVEAQEGINRPQFHHLVGDWIDALPDIAQRLRERHGSRRRRRLRHRLVVDRHRAPLPGRRGRRHRHRRGLDRRAKAHAAAAGVDGRVSFLFADAADADGRGPLRPRDDLRGASTTWPARRRSSPRQAPARARRRGADRRRARRRDVHRPGRRGRAHVLRLQRGGVPGQRPGRQAQSSGRAP